MPYSVPAEVVYSVSAPVEYSTKTPCYTTKMVTEYVVLTNYVTAYGYPASSPPYNDYAVSTPGFEYVESVAYTPEYAASTPGTIVVESIPYTPEYTPGSIQVESIEYTPVTSAYSASTPGVIVVESIPYAPEYSASPPGSIEVESIAYTPEYSAGPPGSIEVESVPYTPEYVVSTPTGSLEVESIAYTPSAPGYAASTPGTEYVASIEVPEVESVDYTPSVPEYAASTPGTENVASVDVPAFPNTTTTTVVESVIVASVIYTSEFSTSIPPALESSAGPPGDLGVESIAYTPPAAEYSAGPPGSVEVESIAVTPEYPSTPTTMEYIVTTPGSIAVESIAYTPPAAGYPVVPPGSVEVESIAYTPPAYSEGPADAPSEVVEVIGSTPIVPVVSATPPPGKDITESIEGLSDCAQTIVFQALANSKCNPSDLGCICGELEFLDVAELVAGTCTNTEAAQYGTFEEDTCFGTKPGPSSIVLLDIPSSSADVPTGGASAADIPLFTPEPEAPVEEQDETTTVGYKVTTTKTVKSHATMGGYATASIPVEEFTGAAEAKKVGTWVGAAGFVGFVLARL